MSPVRSIHLSSIPYAFRHDGMRSSSGAGILSTDDGELEALDKPSQLTPEYPAWQMQLQRQGRRAQLAEAPIP
ncbi:hypothetical protein CLG96_16325 [Sphingomonas oleivorans]|uniref:Uncharacterized protein n=1 Tax=Sphingomonas oleivorans TaxID=1735121 RepID=A0A2T5FUS3_9SPHN|nr:hypothetical protein CLG96_16325 [Sphingomonas oleivorans]